MEPSVAGQPHDSGRGRIAMHRSPYIAWLALTAPLAPMIATLATVAAYTLPKEPQRWPWTSIQDHALAVGTLFAFSVWLLSPLFGRQLASADRMNTRIYGKLAYKSDQLQEQLEVLCCKEKPLSPAQDIACRSARRHQEQVAVELGAGGMPWVLATGYIDVWNRLHRAEEALWTVKYQIRVNTGALVTPPGATSGSR